TRSAACVPARALRWGAPTTSTRCGSLRAPASRPSTTRRSSWYFDAARRRVPAHDSPAVAPVLRRPSARGGRGRRDVLQLVGHPHHDVRGRHIGCDGNLVLLRQRVGQTVHRIDQPPFAPGEGVFEATNGTLR